MVARSLIYMFTGDFETDVLLTTLGVYPGTRCISFQKKKTILHHSHMFLEFSQGCFRGQPPGKLIHVYIVPLLRLLQKDHNAKCFNNEILQYQITFPRRKTSVVITASISSAPSAKITSALPFESAILDEQKYLVPRPLISQPFLFNIKWFQKYSCFPQLEWGKPGGKRCFFKAETYFLKLYLLDDCSTGRDLVMNEWFTNHARV